MEEIPDVQQIARASSNEVNPQDKVQVLWLTSKGEKHEEKNLRFYAGFRHGFGDDGIRKCGS